MNDHDAMLCERFYAAYYRLHDDSRWADMQALMARWRAWLARGLYR